jgi:hypothetical protein
MSDASLFLVNLPQRPLFAFPCDVHLGAGTATEAQHHVFHHRCGFRHALSGSGGCFSFPELYHAFSECESFLICPEIQLGILDTGLEEVERQSTEDFLELCVVIEFRELRILLQFFRELNCQICVARERYRGKHSDTVEI